MTAICDLDSGFADTFGHRRGGNRALVRWVRGQRVRLTVSIGTVTGNGRGVMKPGLEGTVDREDARGARVWFDNGLSVAVSEDDVEFLGGYFSELQRRVLSRLVLAAPVGLDLDTLAGDDRRQTRDALLVLDKMKLVDCDYDYEGYPTNPRHRLTAEGRAAAAGCRSN